MHTIIKLLTSGLYLEYSRRLLAPSVGERGRASDAMGGHVTPRMLRRPTHTATTITRINIMELWTLHVN